MFPHPPFPDHALLDSGGGEKLERFGDVVLRRPDPQALWRRRRPGRDWERADLRFERDPGSGGRRGRWIAAAGRPDPETGDTSWVLSWRGARFAFRPTPFRHVGVFPEQASNWAFLIEAAARMGPAPRLLNLFGYTGIASILGAQAGFEVTHVDASRTSLQWLRENQAASGLAADRLRILLEDASAFARREVRRGARYQGILIDPPHHGRGPKGERWQLEEDLAPLVEAAGSLLAERSFLVLSTYAIGFSPLGLRNLLCEIGGGRVQVDELALPEEARPGCAPRFLPAGFCGRWTRGLDPGEDARG